MKQNRRQFMTGALGMGLVPSTSLLAVTEPYERVSSRMIVGIAAYSFIKHFPYMRGNENARFVQDSPAMDMPGFVRYCAENGADCAELTSYFFPPDADDAYFAHCRKVAHINGVMIAGTAVGNNFSHPKDSPEREEQMAYVKKWIDHAAVMGAPHVRVFAGRHPSGVSAENAERNAIQALEEAGDYAAGKGILLGIENHDSVTTAERLLRIVKAVDNPFVGVNLDSGNFIAEDVYAEIEKSAPYSVNVQIKTEMRVEGGKEPADLERVIRIIKDSGYAGCVVLEYEEDGDAFERVPLLVEKLNELCA